MRTGLALGLALGITGTALAQNNGTMGGTVFEQPYWTQTPVIEVLGRAQVELPPNRASFSVAFVETDKDAKVAMRASVDRARLAYDAIKAVAGDTAIVTTSVSVNPYYEQYRDRDGDRIENRRADKVKGYEGRASVSVTVKDVGIAGEARAAALVLGPEESNTLSLHLERTADVTLIAYEAAVADAAARAKASANAAGATLGQLLVIQEGQGPCLGRWTSQPGRAERGRYSSPMAAPAPQARQERVVVTGTRMTKRGEESVTITQDDIDALNLPSDKPVQTVQAQVCALYAVGN